MDDLIGLYLALSPLVGVWCVRALAVSRHSRRLPTLREVAWGPLETDEADAKWLRLVRRFCIGWLLLFGIAWLMGVGSGEDPDSAVRGALGLTAWHAGYVSQTLRSMRFNLQVRVLGMSAAEENALYRSTDQAFPGFGDRLAAGVTLSLLLMLALLAALLLVGS